MALVECDNKLNIKFPKLSVLNWIHMYKYHHCWIHVSKIKIRTILPKNSKKREAHDCFSRLRLLTVAVFHSDR